MQKYRGKHFTRRSLMQVGSATAAAFALGAMGRYTAEARVEIMAKASAFQDREITLKAIQPVAATPDAGKSSYSRGERADRRALNG